MGAFKTNETNDSASDAATGILANNTGIGANGSTTVASLPGVAGTAGVLVLKPRVTNSTNNEPSTLQNYGWIGAPTGNTTSLIPLKTIVAGVWTFTGTWALNLAYTGTFQIGINCWQVDAGVTTGTHITLPSENGNGWLYTATITPGVATSGTFTLTSGSASLVAFGATTQNFYALIAVSVITKGATGSNLTFAGRFQLPATTFIGTTSETLTTSESAVRQNILTRPTSESLSLSESATRSDQLFRGGTDSLTTSDSAARQNILKRPVSESISTTDSAARQNTLTRPTSESLTTSDSATRFDQLFRNGADVLATSDVATRQAILGRQGSDTVTTSDAATRQNTLKRPTNDAVTTSDVATRQEQLSRTAADNLTSGGGTTVIRPVYVFD